MHEQQLIAYLRDALPQPPFTRTWMNEDCEIIEFEEKLLLVNVDTSTEGRDFPVEAPDEEIGYFCTSLSISDIAACGGEPVGVLVSCCISPAFDSRILRIYSGIQQAAHDAGTYILGGDTNASDEFGLSIVTIGKAEDNQILRRGRAQIGDLVAVTGELSRFNQGFHTYITQGAEHVDFNRMLRQKPPVVKGRLLALLGCVTSCIDLPDGLVKALTDNRGENHGYVIYDQQIPTTNDQLHGATGYKYERASYPAGDIELLFTVPPDCKLFVEERFAQDNLTVHWIGEVVAGREIHIDTGEEFIQPRRPGFLHEFTTGKLFSRQL